MALTRITKGVIKPNENYDTHDINSTGIITATGLNVSGNASIGGVLTYEDVTNIDSIGIITARSDIKVGTGVTLTSAGAGFYAGIVTASNFVKRDGSSVGGFTPTINGVTRGGTSSGNAGSNNTFFGLQAGQNATSTTQRCTAVGAEAFKLGSNYASNVTAMGWYALQQSTGNNNTGVGLAAFQFTTSGKGNTGLGKNCGRFITVGDYNTVIGCDVAQNATEGDNNTLIGYAAEPSSATVSNEITLGDTNINHLRIPGIGVSFSTNGNHISGITTFSSNIHLGDTSSGSLYIGDGNDFRLYHNGQNSVLAHLAGTPNNGGGLFFDSATYITMRQNGNVKAIECVQYDAVKLYHNGSEKFTTKSGGIEVTGSVTDSKGDLRRIPVDTYNSSHTLGAQNAGETVYISSGGVTIPSGTFTAGDAITIINNSGSDQTITCSAVTTYLAGDASSKSSLTLKGRGMATFYFASSSEVYGSGAGLE